MAKFRKASSGIEDAIRGILDRARKLDGYLNRVVYQEYKNRQNERWMTKNTSEGTEWPELKSVEYANYKKKKFAKYPGAGEKLMIATGRLQKAVVGPGKEHKKIVKNQKIVVAWSTPYAIFTEEVRPVNVWDKKKDAEMYNRAITYIVKSEFHALMGGG